LTKFKKPIKFILASVEWTIEWDAKLKSGTLGLCDSETYSIKISKSIEREDARRSTLLHELMHAIYFTYGFKPSQKDSHDHEEEVVSLLSSALFDVLFCNANLTSYLFDKSKGGG
jgi:hypothetical protein